MIERVIIATWLSSVGLFVAVCIAIRELKRYLDGLTRAVEAQFELRDRRHARNRDVDRREVAELRVDVAKLKHPATKHEAVTVELPRARVIRIARKQGQQP